jgi:hypothetical protein
MGWHQESLKVLKKIPLMSQEKEAKAITEHQAVTMNLLAAESFAAIGKITTRTDV